MAIFNSYVSLPEGTAFLTMETWEFACREMDVVQWVATLSPNLC